MLDIVRQKLYNSFGLGRKCHCSLHILKGLFRISQFATPTTTGFHFVGNQWWLYLRLSSNKKNIVFLVSEKYLLFKFNLHLFNELQHQARTGMKLEFFTELKGRVYASVRHCSKKVLHHKLKVKVHAEVRLLFNKSLYTATANSVQVSHKET